MYFILVVSPMNFSVNVILVITDTPIRPQLFFQDNIENTKTLREAFIYCD